MKSLNEFHGDEFFTARIGGSASIRASGTNWSIPSTPWTGADIPDCFLFRGGAETGVDIDFINILSASVRTPSVTPSQAGFGRSGYFDTWDAIMARILTARFVDTVAPKAKPVEYGDTSGGRLLVHPSGRKTWIHRYREPDGRTRKDTLGPAVGEGAISLAT